ncbi:hypothetical protein LENED_000309 [Lentinula edodes]|uniref:Uncharacterized protein n=1 Tax=Lentinula edodes TaxID=5353 RepID=A0A1Q3DVG9_LENED|nr:hypothetical protein LENED_000309 [Lentinula edodes]
MVRYRQHAAARAWNVFEYDFVSQFASRCSPKCIGVPTKELSDAIRLVIQDGPSLIEDPQLYYDCPSSPTLDSQ